ncbi:hypothetical protein CXF59_13900 [Flavobacterium sp. ALD4]|jgi:hypothetical protein|uniref:hypothetical protein n=1 Tax=Flavobacterium sp. ALD4 TaxID=2058314 RepID=UPI000C349C42|nr:hypothetical protein [Flavobacterium sp. ALD4]PKH66992.1 hypothetical protein CXF59_13900 [Flavobacterium sp. ALD4]
MDTNGLTKPANIKQKFQLVKGDFTPSEASDVIMSLIDEKINFHQKQRLQNWEQDHKSDSDEIDDRIDQLEKEKQAVKEFIAGARSLKSNLNINGILEITIVDNQ